MSNPRHTELSRPPMPAKERIVDVASRIVNDKLGLSALMRLLEGLATHAYALGYEAAGGEQDLDDVEEGQ